jgi:hypothetical protein
VALVGGEHASVAEGAVTRRVGIHRDARDAKAAVRRGIVIHAVEADLTRASQAEQALGANERRTCGNKGE